MGFPRAIAAEKTRAPDSGDPQRRAAISLAAGPRFHGFGRGEIIRDHGIDRFRPPWTFSFSHDAQHAHVFELFEMVIERRHRPAHASRQFARRGFPVDLQTLNDREPYGRGQARELYLAEKVFSRHGLRSPIIQHT